MEWFDHMYLMAVFLIMTLVRYGVNTGLESLITFLTRYLANTGLKSVCTFNLNILHLLEPCSCYCSFRW